MMRGIDTNLLVRFVTRDDAAKANRVRRVLTDAAAAGEKLHVSVIVICELARVLKSAYDESREHICDVVAALLETPEIVVEDADVVRRALKDYAAGRADLADALIGHRNRRAGCDVTLTFDGRLERCEPFLLI
jgi:predicted nucleic-acid-binding protein